MVLPHGFDRSDNCWFCYKRIVKKVLTLKWVYSARGVFVGYSDGWESRRVLFVLVRQEETLCQFAKFGR